MPRHLISDAHEWMNEIPAQHPSLWLSVTMKAELREGGERTQPPSPPGLRGPRVTSGRCVSPGPIPRESYPTISHPLRPVSAGCRPRRNRSRGDQRRDRGSRVSSARGESDEGSPSRARPFWRRPWVNFGQKKLLSN